MSTMAAEPELDPRHRILPFKVRAASKESQPHKAAHVVDVDPKNYWSTSTNTKEWLLLELEEPCLLQQIRIHNKSVLEWEIALGLRYKPESFMKSRIRCEAPRRESQYATSYAACRYVRISCLRGNPIAIYSIQLIGIPIPGLEPEFQTLVEHLLPQLLSNKPETQDLYLQLLREIMTRLAPFVTYLEPELSVNSEGIESTLRLLAMLSGPFYPILMAIDEREKMKNMITNEVESSKANQTSLFTVSSNFQAPPRRSRSPVSSQLSVGPLLAFRPDVVLLFMKLAFRDNSLGFICRMVARIFYKLMAPMSMMESSNIVIEADSDDPMTSVAAFSVSFQQSDYSSLFGEDFHIEDIGGDSQVSALLDISSVEEGLLHFLYASVSKPLLCQRLVELMSDIVPVLPFIQAILPALRPSTLCPTEQPDEAFSAWQSPVVQRAFTQIVSLITTPSYMPLLDACAGYLSSFSLVHERAACIIVDLCTGPLNSWLPIVVAKVDLAFELVEGILSFIQVANKGAAQARAALMYVIIGLSGHVDEFLAMYKAAKHNIIFLIEILEAYLLPAITPVKNMIAFGDVSTVLTEKQERLCSLALGILKMAVYKPAVLPALESEWRKGDVKPSLLLSVLAPQSMLPSDIDSYKNLGEMKDENISLMLAHQVGGMMPVSSVADEESMKSDIFPMENTEDPSLFFIPTELKLMNWETLSGSQSETPDFGQFSLKAEPKSNGETKDDVLREMGIIDGKKEQQFLNLHVDYLQLTNFQEREQRAAEFVHLATELHSQDDQSNSHQAAIDALLLAVECHLNPFFMFQSLDYGEIINKVRKSGIPIDWKFTSNKSKLKQTTLDHLLCLEEERDKTVLQILLKAAEWDSKAMKQMYEDLQTFDNAFSWYDSEISSANMIDATTLLRKHQNLLCRFVSSQLQRRDDNINEGLLQGLLFIVSCATELSCSPEQIVDIILKSATHLNIFLSSEIPRQKYLKNSSIKLLPLYRKWSLICRLVDAASGVEYSGKDDNFGSNVKTMYFRDLVPVSAWISKIDEFSTSLFPLVRYIGWKGVAHFANSQQQTGIFLASDLDQLSLLLMIFTDDMLSSGLPEVGWKRSFEPQNIQSINMENIETSFRQDDAHNFLFPELDIIFPSLRKEFAANARAIMETVCLHLKGVSASGIPDLLSWFSEICCHPYFQESKMESQSSMKAKGFSAANIRFVILKLLEVILVEHTEAIVPELPRVFDVVLSLCESAYCDIHLLDSVLKALKPVISFGMKSVASIEHQLEDSGMLTFESLCFNALMDKLQNNPRTKNGKTPWGAFLLFLSGTVLSNMSVVKRFELMHLLINWVKFTDYSDVNSYFNYIFAFQNIFEAHQWLLEKSLDRIGLSLQNILMGPKESREKEIDSMALDISSEKSSDVINHPVVQSKEIFSNSNYQHEVGDSVAHEGNGSLIVESEFTLLSEGSDIEKFEKCMESLLFSLGPSLEIAWKIHPQISSKLTKTATFCLMALSILNKGLSPLQDSIQTEQTIGLYKAALDTVCRAVLTFQQSSCWQVGACMMDFILMQLFTSVFVEVIPSLSSVLQYQCIHAPRVAWRQYAIKWLSQLIDKLLIYSDVPIYALAELFRILLEHKEPEQRMGALQQLDKLTKVDESSSGSNMHHFKEGLTRNRFLCGIVATTWDNVSSLAASDLSACIRKHAIEVLINFIPLAEPQYLQRLLSSADAFLPGLAKTSYTMGDAPATRTSLTLLSRACLYSTAKEINTIPSRVWSSLEVLSKQKSGNILAETERAVCLSLLQLKNHGEDAKQRIYEALTKQENQQGQSINIGSVRQSVLKVFARVNAVRMMEDTKLSQHLQESKDLEEAEIELELVRQEKKIMEKAIPEELSRNNLQKEQTNLSDALATSEKDVQERLKDLRSQILAEEYSIRRAEIMAQRERQKLAQRERQLAREGWTLREIELLQVLDREKAMEAEREIERNRLLERERAKTRELRHNLDLESEKRTQRDLQRELDQRESGSIRPARRDFSGPASGRPRERYRERDSGRSSQDSRSGAAVSQENSTTPPATPTAGSRSHGR